MKRNFPLLGKFLSTFGGTACQSDDFDAADLLQRLHVNLAHGPTPGETQFDRGGGHSSISRVGLVTAIVRISSVENPASRSFCANMPNPSATGGLIVWPRSVEITVRSTPVLRMFANAASHVAFAVKVVVKQCSMIAPRLASCCCSSPVRFCDGNSACVTTIFLIPIALPVRTSAKISRRPR